MDSLKNRPPIITEPLAIERDLGIFTNTKIGDGKITADQAASSKSKTEWEPSGGESCIRVYSRAKEFFKKICNRPDESILICGHQNFLRCLELVIRNEPIDDKHFYSKSPSRLEPGEIREYRFETQNLLV